MMTLIRGLIGTPNNQVVVDEVINDIMGGAHVSQVVVYDTEYIFGAILIILFHVGIFILISNFQKSFSRGRK